MLQHDYSLEHLLGAGIPKKNYLLLMAYTKLPNKVCMSELEIQALVSLHFPIPHLN